jgi:hypothetical protein
MTTDTELVAMFGVCHACYGPRAAHIYVSDTDPDDFAYLLVCLLDPLHGPSDSDGRHVATSDDLERLRERMPR